MTIQDNGLGIEFPQQDGTYVLEKEELVISVSGNQRLLISVKNDLELVGLDDEKESTSTS